MYIDPCINHEPQDVLYIVKCEDSSVNSFPEPLVIDFAILDLRADSGYIFWIGDGDLEVCAFLVALKFVKVLPHDHLD